jgi:hypothetical protein
MYLRVPEFLNRVPSAEPGAQYEIHTPSSRIANRLKADNQTPIHTACVSKFVETEPYIGLF